MPRDPALDYRYIEVVDHEKFGTLILQWARGDGPPQNPMTMEQFKAAILAIPGVQDVNEVIKIPAGAPTEVRFVQGDEDVLYINLSPKHMIEEAIRVGAPSGIYPIPGWYAQILDGVLTDFMEIFERRVGDYTIAGCR